MDNPIAEEACAELIEGLKKDALEAAESEDDAPLDEIESYVRDLFGKYFEASQKKQEAPEKAAPKIAKIIGKQARKKFVPEPEPEPLPEPPLPEPDPALAQPDPSLGSVTGKTVGVDRKILNILNEISAFYETPIDIISGVRTQKAQVLAMYTNWASHLRRGKDNAWLAKNDNLRGELDALKQEKNRDGFAELLNKKGDWKQITRHLTGDEVDLAASTDADIVAAIATCLNHDAGRNSEGTRCHHFDNSRAVWPITESVRARWTRTEQES